MPRGRRLAVRPTLLGVLGTAALLLVTASEGCRTATQVTVELRTVGVLPCTSLKGVSIVVARTPADAEAKMGLESLSAQVERGTCDPDGHTVGTLVITPQDTTGAIIVRARISDAPDATCKPPDYKGCIVARRAFSFIEHASVTLPISLEAVCADVPCDVTSSCRSGACVSSTAVCSEGSAACASPAEPVVLPDGGTVPPEAGSPPDATSDGPHGDATTLDAAVDGKVDAPADATSDANPALYGNSCPTIGGPVDCYAQAQVCCYMGSYFCQSGCTPGYYDFECIGRKHCGSDYCCGNTPSTPGSMCDTTAGQYCSQSGSHYLCTSDADCPPSRSKCTGIYYNLGTGTIKECAP